MQDDRELEESRRKWKASWAEFVATYKDDPGAAFMGLTLLVFLVFGAGTVVFWIYRFLVFIYS